MSEYGELQSKINQLMAVLAVCSGDEDGRVGTPVNFTGALSTGTIAEYIWDFGDGSRGTGVTVQHTYQSEGTYTVHLRVTNTYGGFDIAEVDVLIAPALIPITVVLNGPFDAVQNVPVSLTATVEGDGVDTIEIDPGDGTGYQPAPGGTYLHTYISTAGSPYTVWCRVTDTELNVYTDDDTCTVAAAGVAPIANANGPYTTTVGQPFQLTANGSYTPGHPGDISVDRWEIDYGAGTQTYYGWNPLVTPTVAEGPVDVTLYVTNSFSLTDSDATTLTVNAATGEEILDWFDDAPVIGIFQTEEAIPAAPGTPLDDRGFPRSSTANEQLTMTAAQEACFDTYNGSVWKYPALASTRLITPDIIAGRRIMYQEWLDYSGTNPARGPYIDQFITGTSGTLSYARTWGLMPSCFMLYKPRMVVSNNGANNTTDTVSTFTVTPYDGAVVARVGKYAVIHSGDWTDAEHVYITGVSGTSVTVQRGFKSVKTAHPAGSYFAQHQQGNGGDTALNFAYNLSTVCPTYGGVQAWEFMTRWIAAWYKYSQTGTVLSPVPEIIIDDSSFAAFYQGGYNNDYRSSEGRHRNCSVYNAGTDWGLAPDGTNVWGAGYEAAYNLLAQLVSADNVVLMGGDWKCWLNAAAGTEGELGWDGAVLVGGAQTGAPNYDDYFRTFFLLTLLHTPHETGPCITDGMSKCDPQLYPNVKRFNVAMSCWTHTTYSFFNTSRQFQWCQEGAVELDNANHGRCVDVTAPATILANKNWLGAPLGRGVRMILGPGGTDPTDSMISNGDFSATPVGSWYTTGGTLSWDETQGHTSNGKSLKFVPTITTQTPVTSGSTVQSPAVNLTAGKYYTVCARVKVDECKLVHIQLGSYLDTDPGGAPTPLFRPNVWVPVVMTWLQGANQTGQRLQFHVGSLKGTIWLDQVYLFEDVYAGIHKREFENGIVLANANPNTQTSVPLGGTYEYLTNTGDDNALAGQAVTQVDIPGWDAAILVRETGV